MKLPKKIELIKLLEKIEDILKNNVDKHFSEEAFGAKKWKDGKYSYGKLLNKTGKLKNSFKTKIFNNSVQIFTDVEYAKYHNEGTEDIPRRQFLGDNNELKEVIKKEIDNYLKEIFK